MSMEKEIAALRKKHAAGNLTDFKLRHGIKKIKEKYGKAEPSTVTKVMTFLKKTPAEAGLFTPSPRSAKARAKAKETSKKTTVSDAQKRGTNPVAKRNLGRNIVKAKEKRDTNLIINRAEKAQKKKDNFKGRDAPKGDKKFNVGVSKGGVPFKKAFAHFRKKGAKTFTWNGKKYTTELAKPKGKK